MICTGTLAHYFCGICSGTGASCIYPLLGCACYPDWTFLATEASESSAEWATENVERNPFISDRIQVLQTSGDTVLPISYLNSHPDKQFTLTMSNPPFYASRTEMQESLEAKAGPPTTVCMGSEGELLTQGGELSFVRQHFNESLDFGERIQWFTSLVGKRSNWETLKAEISKDPRVQQVKSHFFQAGRTVRWIIAWSFATESLAVKAKEESVQKDSEGGKRITKRARLNGPT